MTENRKKRYDKAGPLLVKAFQQRHFDSAYVSTKEEAKTLLLSMIDTEHTVAFGGSQTLGELGLIPALKEKGVPLLDRETAKTPEERKNIMKQAVLSHTFLMSSNGISADGQLVNLDGNGNRLAPLLYGPDRVIVCAGMNKVAPTLDDAITRVRNIAAPENAQRFGLDTPCQTTGQCKNCLQKDCICAQMVITRLCRPEKRIFVLLIGEDLGM